MIYFDNAATSYPKPEEVYEAVIDTMRNYGANPGRSGHTMSLEIGRKIFKVREKLKDFINCNNSENIVFTKNATESLNLAIKGLLEKNDHVITTDIEHNSVYRPLKRLEKEKNIEISIVKSKKGLINPLDIEKEIKDNTKLVITNHISNVIGSITDIEKIGKICKKYNIYYLVDAAQSLGVYKIDVNKMNIDLLAFPGHKGLLGPSGTGGLYVKENIKLKSLLEGGTGSVSESILQPDFMPDSLESGTVNSSGIVALGAGIDYINKVGIKNIEKKEIDLSKYFVDGIKDIEGIKIYGPLDENQGPVISINIGDLGSSEVAYILDDKYNIAVRSGLHCAPLVHKMNKTIDKGTVRFSFSYFNTFEEVDIAIKAVKEISSNYSYEGSFM